MTLTTCPKCNYMRKPTDTAPDYECPSCGIIYAKAQAVADRLDARISRPVVQRPVVNQAKSSMRSDSYVERLRSESQYPAFRSVVSVLYLLGLVIGAVTLMGAVISAFSMKSPGVAIGGVVAAMLIFVLSKAGKEAWLMLADMSDATVRMAQRQEGEV